jgi:hypothetical protein
VTVVSTERLILEHMKVVNSAPRIVRNKDFGWQVTTDLVTANIIPKMIKLVTQLAKAKLSLYTKCRPMYILEQNKHV